MPTYDYLCRECGDRFEHFQSMSSPSLKARPDCEVKNCSVERIISGGTGLIFKGSGFYLTDYKNTKSDSKKSKSDKSETKPKQKKTKNSIKGDQTA
ncbi:MAG: FmdB family zinc ribbon protein [Candidatus Neomarinimicrobiota bacterium]